MRSFLVLVAVCGICSAKTLIKRASGDQKPKVFSALDQLRGGENRQLSVDQIQELFTSVKPGQDFPLIAALPQSSIDCAQFKQPGFYADTDSGRCQIFNRCDINGNLTSYLCPNMTLFNQITLVCDWWYNVDCTKAKDFYDYSNSRLYQEVPLLDDENDYVMAVTGAVASQAKPAVAVASKGKGKPKTKRDEIVTTPSSNSSQITTAEPETTSHGGTPEVRQTQEVDTAAVKSTVPQQVTPAATTTGVAAPHVDSTEQTAETHETHPVGTSTEPTSANTWTSPENTSENTWSSPEPTVHTTEAQDTTEQSQETVEPTTAGHASDLTGITPPKPH